MLGQFYPAWVIVSIQQVLFPDHTNALDGVVPVIVFLWVSGPCHGLYVHTFDDS